MSGTVHIGNNLAYIYHAHPTLRMWYVLSLLFSSFALEYTIRKVPKGATIKYSNQVIVYAKNVDLLEGRI